MAIALGSGVVLQEQPLGRCLDTLYVTSAPQPATHTTSGTGGRAVDCAVEVGLRILDHQRLARHDDLDMAALVAATGSVDVGQPHHDAFDVPIAAAECISQPPFDVLAYRMGHEKVPCLNLDLHGYLQVVRLIHGSKGNVDLRTKKVEYYLLIIRFFRRVCPA